jgi:hypothetical protein
VLVRILWGDLLPSALVSRGTGHAYAADAREEERGRVQGREKEAWVRVERASGRKRYRRCIPDGVVYDLKEAMSAILSNLRHDARSQKAL